MLLIHIHLVYEEAFYERVSGHCRFRRLTRLVSIAYPSILHGVRSQQSFLCGCFGQLGVSETIFDFTFLLLFLRDL